MAAKILIDVNICLDVLLDRKPFVEFSGRVFEAAEKGEAEVFISAISFDTLFYIMKPEMGPRKAIEKLKELLVYFKIAPADVESVTSALNSDWNDLEDALQFYSAVNAGCEFIVTRNTGDFKSESGAVEVITPQEFIEKLGNTNSGIYN